MKAALALATAAVLVLALGRTSQAVQVEENGSSFSLEAVKRLQELAQSSAALSPRLGAAAGPLCAEPMLPQEFVPLCKQRGASASLARLAMVPLDVCEICAFAACSGC